jgi:hypothetical protein
MGENSAIRAITPNTNAEITIGRINRLIDRASLFANSSRFFRTSVNAPGYTIAVHAPTIPRTNAAVSRKPSNTGHCSEYGISLPKNAQEDTIATATRRSMNQITQRPTDFM